MNIIKKYILLVFSILMIISEATAQDLYNKKFAVEDLREDFEILKNALQEGHPSLYRYMPQKTMDVAFREKFDNLNDEMSEIEFYNFLKPLIAQIQDGNTSLMLSDYGDRFLRDRARFFPFDVKIIAHKTFVKANYSDHKNIKIGAEILKINGLSASDILEKMKSRIASDAHIESAIFWRLEQEAYAFELLSIYGEKKQFDIEFRNPQSTEVEHAEIMAVSYRKKITDFLNTNQKQIIDPKKPFKLTFIPEHKTAILDLDILGDFFSGNVSFYKFIKKAFREIEKKQTQHLILDLRNNTGGEELYGAYLYSFLTDTTFRLFKKQYITQKKYHFSSFTDAGSSLNREFSSMRTKETDTGKYIISLNGLEEDQFPARENFKGKLYILTNGGTFGVASYIAGLLQKNRQHETCVIGSETASAVQGGTGGRLPYLTLPNSQLILTIPLVRYEIEHLENENVKQGILPDYEVMPDINELEKPKDKTLYFAQQLIQKSCEKSVE